MLIPFVLGLFFWVFLRFAEWGIVQFSRRGKVRVIWLDEENGNHAITYERPDPRDGLIHVKRGGEDRVIALDGRARYGGKDCNAYVVDPRVGYNYVSDSGRHHKAISVARAPSPGETYYDHPWLHVLSISDPARTHRLIARNKAGDSLLANDPQDKWGWVQPLAWVGGIMVASMFGMLVWMVVTIARGTTGA